MPTTRSSARTEPATGHDATTNGSSTQPAPGSKRKNDTSASSVGRDKKHQKTIDETLLESKDDNDAQMKGTNGEASETKSTEENKDAKSEATKNASAESDKAKAEVDTEDAKGNDEKKASTTADEAPRSEHAKSNGSIVEDADRQKAVPSNILEKGIIYFFFRGRVGIEEPHGVPDIARSYIVLRPLPLGAKIGDGALEDVGNNRLLALPKKVLPKSPRDRFLTFVEKASTTVKDIKENFIAGSDYHTKTVGDRHTPAATPMGEGVYAITDNGRETHLAYILTRPSKVDEVQNEMGLRERGSFLTSAKNPEAGGPPNTNLPTRAEYPKEIIEKFRGRGWMPLQPKLLDYQNTQFLLIGSEIESVDQGSETEQKHGKETPLEEMEKLEGEDEARVEHLRGDDPVFEDLDLSSKEYSTIQTTW